MALTKVKSGVRTLGTSEVVTANIADDDITLAKLEDGTQGDILYYGASGAPARLGFGTDGDFLKTQGTGANPVWASAGGLVLITSSNLTAEASSWDFTDCFSATYENYFILVDNLTVATENVDLRFNVGTSDLSTTRTIRWSSSQWGSTNGAVTVYYTYTDTNGLRIADGLHNAVAGWSGAFYVFRPQDSGTQTRIWGTAQSYSSAASEQDYVHIFGGNVALPNTTDVSMQFTASSGNVGDSAVTATTRVYGLVNS